MAQSYWLVDHDYKQTLDLAEWRVAFHNISRSQKEIVCDADLPMINSYNRKHCVKHVRQFIRVMFEVVED